MGARKLTVAVCAVLLTSLQAADPAPTREDARGEQVLRAIDFARESGTGGIQEAIDACGAGGYLAPAGCRVELPRGSTILTRTIRIGATPGAGCPGPECPGRSGIVIQGHGSGFETTEPADRATAGSALRWKGPAGAAMIQLYGVHNFRLQDFSLDGDEGDDGGAAGSGIEIFGDNEVSRPSHGGMLENLYLTDIKDPEPWTAPDYGFAVWIHGAGKNTDQDQVDEIKMQRVEARGVTECLRIESSQAILDSWTGGTCAQFERYGFGILAGSLLVADTYVGQSAIGSAPAKLAGIYLGSRALFASIRDNHFETYAGDTIRTADTGMPGYHTLIEGNSFLMVGDPDKDPAKNAAFIRYLAPRKLTVLANTFLTVSGDRSVHADLRFETQDAGGLAVLLAGNTWTADHVHVETQGDRVSVIALDSFLSQRDPTAGANSIDLLRTGIVFLGPETITWRDGNRDLFRLQRLGEELRVLDSKDRVVKTIAAGKPDGRDAPEEAAAPGTDRFGPARWAAEGTSGSVACAGSGLSCVDAFAAGSTKATSCASRTGVRFVRCR